MVAVQTHHSRHKGTWRHTLGSALALAGSVSAAAAVAPIAIQAPIRLARPETYPPLPPAWHFTWCGKPAPVPSPALWEVLLENPDSAAPLTVSYDNEIWRGLNAGNQTLICPPALLPAGVDPVLDVDCDSAASEIHVRNIVIPPCGRVVLRWEADVRDSAYAKYICNGGTVTSASGTIRTQPPFAVQYPDQAPDTCFLVGRDNPYECSPGSYMEMFETVVDENGPPLLPGDTIVYHAWLDFTHFTTGLGKPNFGRFTFNGDGGLTAFPIPPFLDFVEWVTKPLEPLGATYEFNASRILSIYDSDYSAPPTVPTPYLQVTDFGSWRMRVGCDAPAGLGECVFSDLHFNPGGRRWANDPATYDQTDEIICVIPVQPDFAKSVKTVADADLSGDAQPGELLTFTVEAKNGTACPPGLLGCECHATQVEVVDTIDTSRLEAIQPLDGGQLIAPNKMRWVIPEVLPASSGTVSFVARVKTSVPAGNAICNTATITSAELKNVADGGKSSCPTVPPTSVSLAPCINVRIPNTPFLIVEKTVDPALVPPATAYPVGTLLTYAVKVTNIGLAPASNVDVRDILDAAWKNPDITPKDGGILCTACSPRQIQWPNIPSLAASGGTQTLHFDARIPLDLPDGFLIPNTARGTATQVSTPMISNELVVPVCAPSLEMDKTLPQPTYNEGERIEWTIHLRNVGGCDATGITVRDVIDLARLEDTPNLTWDPPSGVYSAGAISWTVPTLGGNGGQELVFKVSSKIRSGAAPGPVCNTATATWAQSLTTVFSNPAGGTCANISPCPSPIPGVSGLSAVKAVNDVSMTWATIGTSIYNLWRVDAKGLVPEAKKTGVPAPTAVCTPVATPLCVDSAVVPGPGGTCLYYVAHVLCGLTEGP